MVMEDHFKTGLYSNNPEALVDINGLWQLHPKVSFKIARNIQRNPVYKNISKCIKFKSLFKKWSKYHIFITI